MSGCASGTDVERDEPVPKTDRASCLALIKALPGTVSGQKRRDSDDEYAALWGDPAIVLRCGVPEPEAQRDDPFAPCQTVNGIDWFAPESASNDQSSDVTLTTISTEPRVDLTVPAKYRPPVAALVDVADAIARHSKGLRHCS